MIIVPNDESRRFLAGPVPGHPMIKYIKISRISDFDDKSKPSRKECFISDQPTLYSGFDKDFEDLR